MSAQSEEEIWEELRKLHAELEAIKVRRAELVEHVAELHELSKTLKSEASRVDDLADKANGILNGAGINKEDAK